MSCKHLGILKQLSFPETLLFPNIHKIINHISISLQLLRLELWTYFLPTALQRSWVQHSEPVKRQNMFVKNMWWIKTLMLDSANRGVKQMGLKEVNRKCRGCCWSLCFRWGQQCWHCWTGDRLKGAVVTSRHDCQLTFVFTFGALQHFGPFISL